MAPGTARTDRAGTPWGLRGDWGADHATSILRRRSQRRCRLRLQRFDAPSRNARRLVKEWGIPHFGPFVHS
jgi:hypothetical protein